MMRLVLVCIAGHTPLRSDKPVHWPPSDRACSKIVGSNPCDDSQRAAASPPGPAPITATRCVIVELSHDAGPTAACLSLDAPSSDDNVHRVSSIQRGERCDCARRVNGQAEVRI